MAATEREAARPASGLMRVPAAILRAFMLIPILATLAVSLALMAFGGIEAWHFVEGLVAGETPEGADSHSYKLFTAIEIVDLFLLATVIQVVSLGLYQLYFRQDLDLPPWLKIDSLDDLKSKLVAVVVTMLGVFFLGEVLIWEGGNGIAFLGAGVAVVVAALTWFLAKIDEGK